MNKKGFTLVEVLAVIAILGILFGVSIPMVTRYIEKSKQESDEEMTETVKKATVSYLQANKELAPKDDGTSVEIPVTELLSHKYITHELINTKGENCMENSYTLVTKVEEDRYTYDVYLYCGGTLIKNESASGKPSISNLKFSDTDDISNMSFSFSLFVDKNEFIKEYSYVIYAKMNEYNDYEEVYDSGSLSGNNASTLSKTVKIKDQASFINTNKIKVVVTVINNKGIKNTKTITAK